MTLSTEEWKPVEGYEGIYEISNYGRVAVLKNGERFIRKVNTATSYLSVSLRKRPQDTTQKSANVHALVAAAFLGKRPEGYIIRHLDGNRHNNRADNLAYGTPKENINDAIRHGTYKGSQNGRAQLNEVTVKAIKLLLQKEVAVAEISKAIGVPGPVLHAIKQNRNWQHVALG
jgi:hypothetical protein